MPTGERLPEEPNFITLMLFKKLGHRDKVALRKPKSVKSAFIFSTCHVYDNDHFMTILTLSNPMFLAVQLEGSMWNLRSPTRD